MEAKAIAESKNRAYAFLVGYLSGALAYDKAEDRDHSRLVCEDYCNKIITPINNGVEKELGDYIELIDKKLKELRTCE